MAVALNRTVKSLFTSKERTKIQLFLGSLLEEEINRGIFSSKGDPNQQCFWFKRTFSDIQSQKIKDPAMPLFTDVLLNESDFDQEAQKSLTYLKEVKMTAKYTGSVNDIIPSHVSHLYIGGHTTQHHAC